MNIIEKLTGLKSKLSQVVIFIASVFVVALIICAGIMGWMFSFR
jgi:hypothetical protein